ncbi:MAG: hypothetical protein QMC67_05335 [Candidatus Wallbacteria bacterium]
MNYFKVINETIKNTLLKDYKAHDNWEKHKKEILQDLELDETFQFGQNPEVLWLNKIPRKYARQFIKTSYQADWTMALFNSKLSKHWRKICSKYDLKGYSSKEIVEMIDESFFGSVNGQISFLSEIDEIVIKADNYSKFNNTISIREVEYYKLKYENALIRK